MSHPTEFPQRIQLLDSSGQITGSFVPEGVLQQLLSERDRLLEEVKRLQQALTQAETERDQQRRAFEFMAEDYSVLLKRELAVAEKNGITLEQVIEELEVKHGPTERSNGHEEPAQSAD